MTKKMFRRIVAMVLCVTMVFGATPQIIAEELGGGTASLQETDYAQTVDPSTMNDWEKYFGENFESGSTENAGLVWTDKSVFDTTDVFAGVKDNHGQTVTVGENNFLVALSAMASNKQIVGYSTVPTDTVFILDLSESMDDGRYVPSMVAAANDAIRNLLALNKHNRIGVVLYSGNENFGSSNLDHATVLLPLGRYVSGGNNDNTAEFITWDGSSDDSEVKVASTVKSVTKDENGKDVYADVSDNEKETVGGTYIQSGLQLAYNQFEKAYADGTTVIESDLIQGGTKRMPIITLMSDGRPTVATTSYSNVGTSTHGNGGSSNNTITFLTQLTAAYVKASVEEWYDNDAKFYSLWLNSSNDNTANATLQPSSSNTTLDGWWQSFLEADEGAIVTFSEGRSTNLLAPGGGNQGGGNQGGGNNQQDSSFSVTRDGVIEQIDLDNYSTSAEYEEAWLAVQNYIDKDFSASDSEGLENAFKDIVDEIVIQSKYYPTLVESGVHTGDGYVTIEDPLGEFMEVKEIEGFVIGDHLFSGAALVEFMISGDFGNRDTYTENGWALIRAIQERIGVDESTAIALSQQAWRTGQLGRVNAGTEADPVYEYNNYIGWYATENGEYLGFWQEGHTEENVPVGAAKIIKSYGFYGEVETEGSNLYGTQMLYVAVQVATDIDDGDQTVLLEIPASLIPVLTYSVSVDSDSLATAENVSMEITGAKDPIRLLFEVGLRDDINGITVDEIVNSHEGHIHKDEETGEYIFYTNRWGDDTTHVGGDLGTVDPTGHNATVSHYRPSEQNDRYYYTENAEIYLENGVKYTGAEKPSGEGYYHLVYRFEFTDLETGAARIVPVYEKINAVTIEKAESHDETPTENSTWYIPKGTPYRQLLTEYQIAKEPNATGTLGYSDYPKIVEVTTGEGTEEQTVYEAYVFLGNNGLLKMAPAQGIKLSKTVPVVEPDTQTDNFVFEITFAAGTDLSGAKVLEEDGVTAKAATIDDNNDKITVTIAKDETVYIIGIPSGTTYTVTETEHDDYVPVENNVIGTVMDNTINSVEFENTIKEPGHLVISKTVTHPFGADYSIPEGTTFEVVVRLYDGENEITEDVNVHYSGKAYAEKQYDTVVYTSGKGYVFNLGHGESVSVIGLDDGVTYSVTETEVEGDGFTLDIEKSDGLDGTISSSGTSVASLVNNYAPGSVPEEGINIAITGEKNLVGRDWLDEDRFTFTLQYWDGSHWVPVDDNESDTEATKDARDFNLTNAIENFDFNKVGVYEFWVIEDPAPEGEEKGVTYDSTHRYFSVEVTDKDMDGKLEIAGVFTTDDRVTPTTATADGVTQYTLKMDFTNKYAPAGSDDVEVRMVKKIDKADGVSASLAGFRFAVFDEAGNQVGSAYTTDGSGNAVIKLVYGAGSLSKNEETGYYDSVTYNYTIRELTPSGAEKVPGMDYTTDYAELVVTLEDNLVGGITATGAITPKDGNDEDSAINVEVDEDGAIVFTNKYTLDLTSVTFTGGKTLTGRAMNSEDNFTFELYSADESFVIGKKIDSAVIAVDSINLHHGTFGFEKIDYTDSDVGKVYYYVIKEANAGRTVDGVTYSAVEYRITVKIVQDGSSVKTETTIVKADGESLTTLGGEDSIAFENSYATSGKATVKIEGTKNLSGRDPKNGEFTFSITDEKGNIITGIPNVGKTFASPTLAFSEPGEYKFTVREEKGNVAGVTYDTDTVYEVTVTVTDNGKGSLEATVSHDAEDIVFNNSYKASDVKVSVKGTKVLEGKDLVDGDFTFNIYKTNENFTVAEGTEPVSATNKNGEFGFDITFTSEHIGDHYYVIYEDDSDPLEDVDYDESEYQIHINIYDDGSGELKYTLKVNGVENGEITFTNIYDPEDPEDPPKKPVETTKLTVEKVWKDNNDKEGERPESVELVLYADGVRYSHVVIDEDDDWTYTFTNLPKYNENGKRVKYTIAEEKVPKNYSVSYNTTWFGKVIVTNTYGEEFNPSTGAPGMQ